MQFVETGLTAFPVVSEVGGDVIVEVALAQHFLVLYERLVVEDLLVGGDDGIHLRDLAAGGVLATDDPDLSCRVLMQTGKFRTVHDTLVIEVAQTVGDDAQVVVAQARDTVAVVLIELSDLFACDVIIDDIIGLIEVHQTVALGFHGGLTLIDGEVERGAQVVVAPGLALFDLEGAVAVPGHQPYNDGHGTGHDCQTDEEIAPRDIVFCIKTAHFLPYF